MILYVDASALVKRYVSERGSQAFIRLLKGAEAVGTALVTRAEVSAGLAKGVRAGALEGGDARSAFELFQEHWPHLLRIQMSEALIEHASGLAWDYSLRGYDAVHLASALQWQTALAEPVTVATFDRRLWGACAQADLEIWPEDLASYLG